MTKIGNMQKIMISLDISAEEKSFLNWPENLPLKYQALVSGHPVYYYNSIFCNCNGKLNGKKNVQNLLILNKSLFLYFAVNN